MPAATVDLLSTEMAFTKMVNEFLMKTIEA